MAVSVDSLKKLLGRNYDCAVDLTPYVRRAAAAISRISACAVSKGTPLTTTELALIEETLAAHYYTKTDPVYSSRSTAGASGSFVRDPKNPEPYKSMLLEMDPSGCVAEFLTSVTAEAYWGGKPANEQLSWDDRNL